MGKHILTIEIEAGSRLEAENKLSTVMHVMGIMHQVDKSSVIGAAFKIWLAWGSIALNIRPVTKPYPPGK